MKRLRWAILAALLCLGGGVVVLAQGTAVNPPVGSVWTYLGATYGASWLLPSLNPNSPYNCANVMAFGGINNDTGDNTSAFNAAAAASKCVLFPAGTYRFATAQSYTVSGNKTGLTILGAGQDITVLHWPGAVGTALSIGKNQWSQSFHIRDLTMTTGQINADVAIHITQTKTATSTIQSGYSMNDVTRVTFRSDEGYWEQDMVPAVVPKNGWKVGVQITNDSVYDLIDVTVYGPAPSGSTGGVGCDGIIVEGTTATVVPVIFNISRANMSWLQHGLIVGANTQGYQVTSSNFTGNNMGIYVRNPGALPIAVGLTVSGSQFNNTTNIALDGQVSVMMLSSNLFYTRESSSVLLNVPTAGLNITGNTFSAVTIGVGNGIDLSPSSTDVFPAVITGNAFYGQHTAIYLGPGTNGAVIAANRYQNNTQNVSDLSPVGVGSITGGTNNGAVAYSYVTGAVNNGSGQTRVTINPASTQFFTGQYVLVGNVGGIYGIGTGQYLMSPIQVIDSTHLDLLLINFSGTYTSGGSVSSLP